MRKTTFLQRFGDALELLCQGKRPSDEMMAGWIFNESDALQDFAACNTLYWAQGIGAIDAAFEMASQPCEGEDHESFDEAAKRRKVQP